MKPSENVTEKNKKKELEKLLQLRAEELRQHKREQQIALALERVQDKALTMQGSEDISETTAVFFHELNRLGIEMERCGIVIFNDTPVMEVWSTPLTPEANQISKVVTGKLDSRIHPMLQGVYSAWEQGKKYFSYTLKGDEIRKYYEKLNQLPEYQFPETTKYPETQIDNCFYFNDGHLFVYTKSPLTEDVKKIFHRFTKMFSLAYTRYLDIKKAEKQAHEAEIEAALERVRAKALAMHSSKDISDATAVVFNELSKLGIVMDRCGIATYTDTPIMKVWSTPLSPENKQVIKVVHGDLDYRFNSLLIEVREAWENKQEFFTRTYEGDEVKEYYTHLLEAPDYHFPVADEYPEKHVASMCYFKQGFIFIWTQFELTESVKVILKRFTKEFSGTYTRYLDLKKAEAQARESKIEAALERVRAKAMAMHSSKDISDATAIVFNELTRLGIDLDRAGIVIFNEKYPVAELWSTRLSPKNKQVVDIITGNLNFDIHPMLQVCYRDWKDKKVFSTYELAGDEIRKYYELLAKQPGYQFPKTDKYPDRQIANSFFDNEVSIFVFTEEKLTEKEKQILHRFSKVFSHTYRRYQDLIKAEAQAREAQVEASLERVRAKAMAMRSSKDISGAVAVVFNELTRLGIELERCGIGIFNDTPVMELWSTPLSQENRQVVNVITGKINSNFHPMTQESYQSWKDKEDFFSYELKGEQVKKYYQLLEKEPGYNFPKVTNYAERQILNSFNFDEGGIFVYSREKLPVETKKIIHRFSKVFSLTYKRYVDLINAEAQAREARIEASLERVRAKAMAMHNSEDISGATAIVFDELTRLGIEMERCGIVILDDTPIMEVWSTLLSPENKKVVDVINGKLDSKMHIMLQEVYKAWMDNKESFSYTLDGDEVRDYYDRLEKEPGYRFPKVTNYPHQQIANCFYFNEGYVFAYTVDELSEDEKHVFQRFTSVFSLTYRRYLDLIKAEAQVREAIKQASLNRVRGEIASMRNAEDLKRITPVIWQELKKLEVPFIRCGVFIISDETEKIKAHLSTPSGEALAVLDLKFDENKLTKDLVLFREKNKVYKIHWNKSDFINWMKSMMKSGQVQSAEQYQGSTDAPESLDLHFIPFKQGMLYVGNSYPLSGEELELADSLAKSFSVAYARYEDFKNLEIAKEKIEKTLDELKAAQSQLIQSEKMASLGELTAGIAHEIQNPLNFVNNFSELSNELFEEMNEELANGNMQLANEIAGDIKQNLEKINHHGKRAESIVKGMLFHSRGSSGKKEPTDINAMCDEYLRLAYHGFRAKDKSFNADYKLEIDESLPKINVVPQDIGRVLLNLINNAFYVINKKAKENIENYKPEVTVRTSSLKFPSGDLGVEITVNDNGPGIPDKIKDKIFHPFFTTKPTGEGTGLGLSLSYDIVKAHGGDLKIETTKNEGSEFIIWLPLS